MTRDDDLVRQILIHIEEKDGLVLSEFDVDEDTVLYHVEILIEADYVSGEVTKSINGRRVKAFVERLTWKGHEFLEDIRSDTVWNETKKRVSNAVGSASLSVIQRVAEQVIVDFLN